jgi:peptide-methionine (S)-S-oxide reductase
MTQETLILGGGCFWCVEAVFSPLRGVTAAISGYAGGQTANPDYESVCSGRSGHAEVVAVSFDPASITRDEILDIFFAVHDPTTPNRQGADAGTQYRSVIYYADEAQRLAAEKIIARLTAEKVFAAPIVTELAPLVKFYPAEDYHQNYYARNPRQSYCQMVIAPKLAKVRARYASRLRAGE